MLTRFANLLELPQQEAKQLLTDEEIKKMTTLAQACKIIVKDAIDHDYLVECNQTVEEVYEVEFRKWNGCTPKACKDYLQGLPGVCTVPFYNGEILELLAAQGITRATEAGKEHLIEAYWNECGYQFWKLVK